MRLNSVNIFAASKWWAAASNAKKCQSYSPPEAHNQSGQEWYISTDEIEEVRLFGGKGIWRHRMQQTKTNLARNDTRGVCAMHDKVAQLGGHPFGWLNKKVQETANSGGGQIHIGDLGRSKTPTTTSTETEMPTRTTLFCDMMSRVGAADKGEQVWREEGKFHHKILLTRRYRQALT